jgi:hypothetical protein
MAGYPDNDNKQFAGVVELVSFRNEVIHASTPRPNDSPLLHKLDTSNVERLLSDLKAFVEDLHASFRQSKKPLVHLPQYAFEAGQRDEHKKGRL